MLVRALFRALLRSPGRLVGALCLCAAAICAYAGTVMGLGRVEDTTAALYRDLRLHDLELRTEIQAADGLPAAEELVRQVPGVGAASWRLLARGSIEIDSPASVPAPAQLAGAVLLAWPPGVHPAVDDVLLVQGELPRPGHPEEAVVDQTFAADLGLHVGDSIWLRAIGKQRRIRLSGIAVLPEFLMNSVDQSFPVPIRRTMAVLVLSQEAVAESLDGAPGQAFYNSLVVRLAAGARREQVRDHLRQRLDAAGTRVTAVTWVEDQFSVLCNRNRLRSYSDSMPTFIAVFTGLAFLVVSLVMRRLARSWQREVATLLAYGVPLWRVACGWAGAALLLFLGAAVLGSAGAWILQARISAAYLHGTGFPLLLRGPGLAPLGLALLLSLGTLFVASLLPILTMFRRPPAQLLRQEVALESTAALLWIRRVDAPLGRLLGLGGPERLGLRNVLRRPLAFGSSVACIALMMVGTSSNYFFGEGLERGLREFLDAQRWDLLVELTAPLAEDELRARLRGAGAAILEPVYAHPARLRFAGQERSYQLVASEVPAGLRRPVALLAGAPLRREGDDEILINLRLSLDLGVGVGDGIEVLVEGRSSRLRVAAILGNNLINQALVGRATLTRVVGHPTLPVAALVTGPEGLALTLSRLPEVGWIVPRAAVARTSLEACQVLVAMVRLYGHLSAGLGALLVLLLVLTGVTDRAGEYALLRSLGTSGWALLRALFVEVALMSTLALLLALPLTALATTLFQRRIMRISDWVPVEITLRGYAHLAGPALVYMLLAVGPALRRVLRLPLAVVLRQRSLG